MNACTDKDRTGGRACKNKVVSRRHRLHQIIGVCSIVAAIGPALAACGANQIARTGVARKAAAHQTRGVLVVYRGLTSQHRTITVVVDRGREVVTALRFSIGYACSEHRVLTLRALILRPDDSWALVARWPSSVIGFSDWFSGPSGHDFHVTGTLATDASSLNGTIHSLLRGAGQRTGCDSGHLRFRAALSTSRAGLPVPASLTLHQYKALPSAITIASAQRILGPANDRDIFSPAGVITATVPSGPAGSRQSWLDYRWTAHPRHYFQFFFRRGRLLPHNVGRSIAET